jgi:hypothetical protein
MFRNKIFRVAATVSSASILGLTMASPADAHVTAGPTQVCYNYVGIVLGSFDPGLGPYASFALDGVFVLNGVYNQNGNGSISGYFTTFMYQSSNSNSIIIEARNDASNLQSTNGWMVEMWKC